MSISVNLKNLLMYHYDRNGHKYTIGDAIRDISYGEQGLRYEIANILGLNDEYEAQDVIDEFGGPNGLASRYRDEVNVWIVVGNEYLVSSEKPDNNLPRTVTSMELRVGDTVANPRNQGGFNTMVVKAATETTITFYRPYVHFGTTGYAHSYKPYTPQEENGTSIICYMGLEDYTIDRRVTETYTLLSRAFIR